MVFGENFELAQETENDEVSGRVINAILVDEGLVTTNLNSNLVEEACIPLNMESFGNKMFISAQPYLCLQTKNLFNKSC